MTIRLTLELVNTTTRVDVESPMLLADAMMDQAWGLLSDFVMDTFSDITDEQFREIFIEVCYRLIYREMTTLKLLPDWEQNFRERLARGKSAPRVRKESPYGIDR